MSLKTSGQRNRRLVPKADTAPDKRNPHSLIETLRSIRQKFNIETNSGKLARTTREFAEIFNNSFQKILNKYPGSGKNPSDLSYVIERSESGNGDLPYYVLRSYADFVGVPTGILLIFSHIVGDSKRGDSIDMLIHTLSRMIESLDAARISIDQSRNSLFHPLVDSQLGTAHELTQYNVRTEVLEAMARAYANSDP